MLWLIYCRKLMFDHAVCFVPLKGTPKDNTLVGSLIGSCLQFLSLAPRRPFLWTILTRIENWLEVFSSMLNIELRLLLQRLRLWTKVTKNWIWVVFNDVLNTIENNPFEHYPKRICPFCTVIFCVLDYIIGFRIFLIFISS